LRPGICPSDERSLAHVLLHCNKTIPSILGRIHDFLGARAFFALSKGALPHPEVRKPGKGDKAGKGEKGEREKGRSGTRPRVLGLAMTPQWRRGNPTWNARSTGCRRAA
jgi:hypothetical protein